MPKKNSSKGKDSPLLRAEAEVKLTQGARAFSKESEKTQEELIHELQVHQIELEMQNDELRRAHLELEESRDKYIELYDFAPVGYFTFTRDALIQEVNLTGASLLGIDRQKLINARFRRFIAPEDHETWDRYLLNVFVIGQKQACDLRLIRVDTSVFYARIESIRITEKDGLQVVRTALSDISIQKKAQGALQQYSYELEKSNKELQDALGRVQTLSGLLPICSMCKKIRDDKGYWSQIESYISDHSDALFSHGYCPVCAEKATKELEDYLKRNPNSDST